MMKTRSLFLSALSLALFFPSVSVTAEPELPPEPNIPCFPGAYYRKAVSSYDRWSGIEGTVVLPHINFDMDRLHPKTNRPLDNASIYMGGRVGEQEIDAGLTWEVIREADGTVSSQRKAWRPFWRNNEWFNAPAVPEYYYYPGDVIRMRCSLVGENELELLLTVLERAPESPSQQLSTFTTKFEAPGFSLGEQKEFKRVNAIDQFGNEGLDVTPTRTRIEGAEWREVHLLLGEEQRPFVPARFTDMRCPNEDNIRVTETANAPDGGERIDIIGSPTKQEAE